MSIPYNRVKQAVTGSSTGDLTLGAAATGYVAATTAYSPNARFVALIEQDAEWEHSVCYYHTGTVLVREACIRSSNADAFVDFPAGEKFIAVVPMPARILAAPPASATHNLSDGYSLADVVLAPPYSGAPAGQYRCWVCTEITTTTAKWTPLPFCQNIASEMHVLGGDLETSYAAQGPYSTVINGAYSQSGEYGVSFGRGAMGQLKAALSIGGGVVLSGSNVETQISALLLSAGAVTTDATATKIAFDFDHATYGGLYVDSGVLDISATVTAFEPATGDAKRWKVEALARMTTDYVTFELIGTPTVVSAFASAGAAAWDVAVSVDTGDATLDIAVTGEAAHSIKWGATITACSLIHYV